jgi:hypothetical protein
MAPPGTGAPMGMSFMGRLLPTIPQWRDVDIASFQRDIVPLNKPAVLKGLAADWPAVREAARSSAALAAYIKRFDAGKPAQTLVGPSSIKGRFFYKDGDLRNLNFVFRQEPIGAVIDWLLAHENVPDQPAIAIQSVPLPDHLPGFAQENAISLPHASAIPRIWIGNSVTVSTHFDFNYNIACVVAGRRRFTLFPPEQLPNLYIGPLEHTPAGPPTSMVSLEDPDFTRYPRFEKALDAAMQAELEPGDAIYIPYMWWHHVKSLCGFNLLVNYWWNDATAPLSSPFNCLVHALLTLKSLPQDQRAVWRMMFDHYVFGANGDPAAHLDPADRGVLGTLSPELIKQMQSILLRSLNR